jgi:hypothetical protein
MRVKFVFIYIIGNYSPNFSFFLPDLSTQSAMTSNAQNTDQQLLFSGRLTADETLSALSLVRSNQTGPLKQHSALSINFYRNN